MITLNVIKVNIILALLSLLVIVGIAGCSSYQKTTDVSTQRATVSPVEKDNSTVATENNETNPKPTEKETVATSKTETVTESKGSHGLIGGFFYFIGEVIAFPFKVIGGVFDAIF